MIESSILSPNRALYGDMHNMGHVFISYIHDPDHRHLESFGVIGDSATAMRDPIFYRWHAFIDDIFQQHKGTLPRYDTNRVIHYPNDVPTATWRVKFDLQLNYPGITVTGVQVSPQGGGGANKLTTFWQQSDVDLSRGMDFQPRGSVFVRFTHLNHQPFNYQITVDNKANGSRRGTCRIFIAPKFDERGNPWQFTEQRNMFIELDRFNVNCKSHSKDWRWLL